MQQKQNYNNYRPNAKMLQIKKKNKKEYKTVKKAPQQQAAQRQVRRT